MFSLEVMEERDRRAITTELTLALETENKPTLKEAEKIARLLLNYFDRGIPIKLTDYMYIQEGHVYIHDMKYTIRNLPKGYLPILFKYLLKTYRNREGIWKHT